MQTSYYENNGNDETDGLDLNQIRNICSWLLHFSPAELVVLSAVLSILITTELTIEEQAIVGSFLTTTADNIFLISAQQVLIQTAKENLDSIKEKQKEEQEKEAEKKSQEQTKEEILKLKIQLQEIEDLLKKQLKT